MADVGNGEGWSSRWGYGDLPEDEKIQQMSALFAAMAKLLEDELGPFIDEDTSPEIVLIARFRHNGKTLRVGVTLPDDNDGAISVVEDILGAMRQQQSEAKLD